MSNQQKIVQRLRSELRKAAELGTWHEIDRAAIRERVATLVLASLRDDGHGFTEGVHHLRTFIEQHKPALPAEKPEAGAQSSSDSAQITNAFYLLPAPGLCAPELQRFWPYQMLLWVAALSSSGKFVGDSIGLTDTEWNEAVEQAKTKGLHLHWSKAQWVDFLEKALVLLDEPDSEIGIKIEGDVLRVGPYDEIHLSQNQKLFLTPLLARPGQFVTKSEFGSLNPELLAKIKHDFMVKLNTAGIELPIVARDGAYALIITPGSPGSTVTPKTSAASVEGRARSRIPLPVPPPS